MEFTFQHKLVFILTQIRMHAQFGSRRTTDGSEIQFVVIVYFKYFFVRGVI